MKMHIARTLMSETNHILLVYYVILQTRNAESQAGDCKLVSNPAVTI
jgi:hypothetical protein